MKQAIEILRREIGVSEARLAILKMDGVADEIPDVLDEIKDMRAAIAVLEDSQKSETLEKALAREFNRFGVDSALGTPDFILAKTTVRLISYLESTVDERARWFGQHIDPAANPELPGLDPEATYRMTFDQFVEHGIEWRGGRDKLGGHEKIPWHFEFHGYPVTHENDFTYRIEMEDSSCVFRRGGTISPVMATDGRVIGFSVEALDADLDETLPAPQACRDGKSYT